MTNGKKFRKIFKEFATEVWAFSEKDFLTWLNADYEESTIRNCFGCKYSKDNHNQAIEECHLCMWENQYILEQEPILDKIRADYENRLKADLKAILVELQLEIEEIKPLEPTDDEDWQYGCFHGLELMQDKCLRLIQQKIDSLKNTNN